MAIQQGWVPFTEPYFSLIKVRNVMFLVEFKDPSVEYMLPFIDGPLHCITIKITINMLIMAY